MRIFWILCLALAVAGCTGPHPQRSQEAAAQTPTKQLAPKLLDVRSAAEYASGHLPGAINVPVADIEQRILEVAPDKQGPILLHCQSGRRSSLAKAKLDKLGYANVRDLGSIDAARAALDLK